jgi:hypothetical protein
MLTVRAGGCVNRHCVLTSEVPENKRYDPPGHGGSSKKTLNLRHRDDHSDESLTSSRRYRNDGKLRRRGRDRPVFLCTDDQEPQHGDEFNKVIFAQPLERL